MPWQDRDATDRFDHLKRLAADEQTARRCSQSEWLSPKSAAFDSGDIACMGQLYCQNCSRSLQTALASYGMTSSMSCKSNCCDHAPTASLWGSLKVGRLYGKRFATQREAMADLTGAAAETRRGHAQPACRKRLSRSLAADDACRRRPSGARPTHCPGRSRAVRAPGSGESEALRE